MKLLTFSDNGHFKLGIKTEKGILDVAAAIEGMASTK